MRISPGALGAVKAAVDIVEVVSAGVVLRAKGRRSWGLCPFHVEKTPSFSVDPEQKTYHCYGCGAHGDSISFIQEIEGLSFTEAVLDLGRRYNVEIDGASPEQEAAYRKEQGELERLRAVVSSAADVYHKCLLSPEGKPALDYLLTDRRLTLETIKEFQLGYAPPGDRLFRYLLRQGFTQEEIGAAGLIRERQGAWGDYFRERVTIPILDNLNRPIAFGARGLANQRQKYLNSPDTPLYQKGASLFGLARARPAIRENRSALVVEGYFDAIALHQAGLTHAVAIQGTAFSDLHLKMLSRYSAERLIFNFDGDGAGDMAIDRAVGAIEPAIYGGVIDVSVLRLPDGYDPDSYLRDFSGEEYRQVTDTAPHWFDWRLGQLSQGDLSRPEEFSRTAKEMRAFLSRITETNRRLFYLHRCAEILCRGDHSLLSFHAQNLRTALSSPDEPAPQLRPAPTSLLQDAERLAIRLYLYCPSTRRLFRECLERGAVLTCDDTQALWKLIGEIEAHFGLWEAPDDYNVVLETAKEHAEDTSLFFDYGLSAPAPEKRMDEALAVIERRSWEDIKAQSLAALQSGDFSAQAALMTAISRIKDLDSKRRSRV